MTRDEFWSLIEVAKAGDDPYERDLRCEDLQTKLSRRSLEDIVDFERHLSDLLAISYTWKLWGAAYLINGGCSDDAFEYFRGWLITQGKSAFENALANADSLADISEFQFEAECEHILYVAGAAYKSVSGNEIPEIPINLPDLGEGWDFDDDSEMRRRYPKLFAKVEDD